MTDVENRELLELRDCSVASLFERAKEINEDCRDYTVRRANLTNCRFNDEMGLSYSTVLGIRHSPISRYALSQLNSKIGVPTKYIEKCIDSGRLDLAQENVNSWLQDYNKDLFIREYQNSIRGILSTRYSVCDTNEILEVVCDELNSDDFNVKGHYLTPERFHLRLVSKEKMRVPNEDLFAGLMIDSSDVGKSVLQVRFLVFKQVCTNGLIVSRSSNNLFRQKHIGISASEFEEGFKKSISLFPKLIEEVEQMIILTSSESTYKFTGLSDEDFEKLVERISKTAHISDDDAGKVISIMQSGRYENSKWGYINALTEVARDMTLEKRLEVETYAGSLLVA